MKPATAESDFVARRRPQPPEALAPDTVQWLEMLPDTVRPNSLSVEFPRIANSLRREWGKPQACFAYFDDLLIDRRGGRQGFPGMIAIEIALLKDYYESAIHRRPQATWDHIRADAERR